MLEDLYGDRLKDLILYGSQARGDAHADSDIDVLVVLHGDIDFTEESRRTSRVASEILLRHQTLLCFTPVAAAFLEDTSHPLVQQVQREGLEV